MLDLNYVRENFTKVLKALEDRNSSAVQFAADFVNFDVLPRNDALESPKH